MGFIPIVGYNKREKASLACPLNNLGSPLFCSRYDITLVIVCQIISVARCCE